MKVGVIGKGFVGNAVYENFKDKFEVGVYDIVESKKTHNFDELVEQFDYLFVCVPTPMSDSGECDISLVEEVVANISKIRKDKTVIIKSTVLPGTTQLLSAKYGLNIAFNPEFLTEANSIHDFKYQPLIVVGADQQDLLEKVWQLYHQYITKTGGYMPLMKSCKSNEAEMFKYLANCFLATKVIFANEFKLLCDKLNIEYNNVADIARLDSRLGATHWSVPGPDGKMGFGGSCFPKDTSALISFADQAGSTLWLLTEATYINDEVREGKFFKNLEVVEDK